MREEDKVFELMEELGITHSKASELLFRLDGPEINVEPKKTREEEYEDPEEVVLKPRVRTKKWKTVPVKFNFHDLNFLSFIGIKGTESI